MKNLKFIFILSTILFLSSELVIGQTLTANHFQVNPGVTNGIKFWGDTDNYKIHLSNTFNFGTITETSLRSNMRDLPGRGWTWGLVNEPPVTGFDTKGNIQTEGYVKSMIRQFYFGDNQRLESNDNQYIKYYSNNSSQTGFVLYDKEETSYGRIFGNGNGANFGLVDGNGYWTLLNVKNDYTAFKITGKEIMRLEDNGYVGIGTDTPQYELDVCGRIRGKEVIVEDGWCDYVFDEDYSLKSIDEQVEFIEENGHLLNFESAATMAGEINVGDVTKRQQQTIEEQMLYIGQLNKDNKELKEQNDNLQAQFNQLHKLVTELQEKVEK